MLFTYSFAMSFLSALFTLFAGGGLAQSIKHLLVSVPLGVFALLLFSLQLIL